MASLFKLLPSQLKSALDTAEKLLQAKGIVEYGDEIRQLHTAIVTALKNEAAAEQEIQALKREVADLKANNANLERYELNRLPTGALVMALRETEKGAEPFHYACEKCHSNGNVRRLQPKEPLRGAETLGCDECGSRVTIGISVPQRAGRAHGMDFDVFNP